MKVLYIFAIILFLFCSCQAESDQTKEEHYESADYTNVPPPPDQSRPPKNEEEQSELKSSNLNSSEESPVYSTVKFTPPILLSEKIIRHAYVIIQVKDYTASTQAIKNYISKRQGFIAKAEEERTNGNLQNSLTIRVADNNFETLLQDLQQESVFLEHKNVTVKDVSEEYVDIETRLKTKKKVEERYLALLSRANNVKDILAIETELSSLQEDIESTEGRRRYLQNQVAYSTIILDYSQTVPSALSPNNTISKRIVQALTAGLNSTVTLAIFLIQLWPLVLLLAMGLSLYFRLKRNRLAAINPPNA